MTWPPVGPAPAPVTPTRDVRTVHQPSPQDDPSAVPDLSPQQRQERISALVLKDGSVDIRTLAELFGVSQMTVHRDLSDLEERGVLRKVRGGATAQPSNLFESYVEFRMAENLDAKRAVARQAVQHIEPGDAVMLDDSTTSYQLATMLAELAPLTVITNFLPTISLLHDQRGISLLALGGRYYPPYGAFLGPMTDASVRALRANVLFLSTSALSDGVLYHQYQDIANGKQVLMGSAARRILLVDHTKLDKEALHRVVPVSEFDLVIVDDGVRADDLRCLRDQAPVELAPR